MSTAVPDGPLADLIADAREIPPPFQPPHRSRDGQPVNGGVSEDVDARLDLTAKPADQRLPGSRS